MPTYSSRWRQIEWVGATGSTNADLAAAWRAGEAGGRVLIADHQTAGRGRFDRSWVAPPGAMVALSVLLRPDADDLRRWAWLPLLAGLAVAEALREAAGVDAAVKWPNDVLVGEKKICGILAERVLGPSGAAIVIGIGVNTAMTREQAPVAGATSLAMEGAPADPRPLVAAVLRRLDAWVTRWAADEELVGPYAAGCATIGRDVRVLVSPDETVEGRAAGVDADGRLLVDAPEGRRRFAAGDVWHLR